MNSLNPEKKYTVSDILSEAEEGCGEIVIDVSFNKRGVDSKLYESGLPSGVVASALFMELIDVLDLGVKHTCCDMDCQISVKCLELKKLLTDFESKYK